MYRVQRSSSNGTKKEQLQQGAKEQQKGANRSSSFYSATNRFVIVFSATNRLRTVCSFRLNGWGVSYNGKGSSVFVSFRKNSTITLYCHIPYVHSHTLKRFTLHAALLQSPHDTNHRCHRRCVHIYVVSTHSRSMHAHLGCQCLCTP